jgi:hypothetical protein
MSRLRVAPDRAQELVRAFRGRAHLVDDAAGFLELEVWQSDAHRGSHDRIDATLGTDIKLQSLEHMHSFNVVAQ